MSTTSRTRTAVAAAGAVAAAMVLSGCGSGEAGTDADGLAVAASFYPLQFVAERVGGSAVAVTNLTPPGAEAHDVELTPGQVATVASADLVVYLGGFQPSVDAAVDAEAADAGFDVGPVADLTIAAEEHEGEEHEGEEEGEHAGEGIDGMDPHFWLDPVRLAGVGDAVADRLAEVDPDNAATYRTNAGELRTELEALDEEFRAGTAQCTSRDLVTSHEAFAYLADAYAFQQVGIAGVSPSQEPTPAELAAVTEFVRANGVRTIYFETLVSPDVARTVARETGAATAVLDPLEGLSDASAGDDYVAIMRANLASIRTGQPCE